MALEDLLAQLEREAEARGEALLREARAEAREIESETARRLERRRTERLERREAEARAQLESELAAERRRARAAVLRARERLLDRIFDGALDRLERDGEVAAGGRALAARLGATLGFIDGPAVVSCAPEVERELRAALGERRDATVVAEPGLGPGFIVRSREGRLEIDERPAARLRRQRRGLSVEVMGRVERWIDNERARAEGSP